MLSQTHKIHMVLCTSLRGPRFPNLVRVYRGSLRLWLLQVGLGYSLALGSGLVVARGEQGGWSPPSALSFASVGWGLQAGGALHDLLIVLRNRLVSYALGMLLSLL